MSHDHDRALALLRLGTGMPGAAFRDGQEEAIEHVVEGRGRLLVVQKTGWGKSFVYFIATMLLREQGLGPTLLISPLLSLMRNQLAAASRMGVRAARITSDNQEEWSRVEADLRSDQIDLLLVSPERLASEHFTSHVLAPIAGRIALMVIDEAHCISDWGHDFRPHYRLIERIARSLPRNLRLLATTATANHRVMADLQQVLGPELAISKGDLNRPSLTLQTIRLPGQAARLAWLAENLPRMPGSGIIYTLTIRDANLVSAWLKSRGLPVEAYSSQQGEARAELEDALLENRVKALVATTALGMGFDKPDLAFVGHFQAPGSVVAYYQQVGRAGRALESAYGVLLSGAEEASINDYFVDSAFPTRDEVDAVLQALQASSDGLTVFELQGRVNLTGGRIEKSLSLLSLESPAAVVKQGPRWTLTASTLSEAFWQRAERLTSLRREEQAELQAYVDLPFGHMEFLIRALDGDPGTVGPPRLPRLPTTASPGLVQEALAFLRRTGLPFEPRKQWPPGGLPRYGVSGKITPELRAEAGKALCVWRDSGWGELVYAGKYQSGRFDAQLVDACAELVRAWSPQPAPTWVTCVPSLRHPSLVPDLARRLGLALGLPFHAVLAKTDERPEQKTMANSTYQARNLDGALAVVASPGAGPVLLVDDMVDSGWTLTVSAWLLRSNGSGVVWPLALAVSGGGE
ncbi:MAG TPA: RecQ family ATP-dependent DNA helicase [Kofleriaceae bacterium]|nr:RecQ family ATP-dependent DNA helicase [Kofleriaceae bacterium]